MQSGRIKICSIRPNKRMDLRVDLYLIKKLFVLQRPIELTP